VNTEVWRKLSHNTTILKNMSMDGRVLSGGGFNSSTSFTFLSFIISYFYLFGARGRVVG
jgi:hypothetical protein